MSRHIAPAILAAVLLATSAAAQEKVDTSVQVDVSGGLWDNGVFDDEESFAQESITLRMQSEELILEFRGRGLFTPADRLAGQFNESNAIDDVDIDGHSRYYDVRGLVGWAFPLGSINRLEVLAGLGYRDTTILYRPDTGTHYKTNWRLSHADLGLRHGINLGEHFEVVTEAVGGMMIVGTQDDHELGVGDTDSDLEYGFVGEARTAVNWYVTKRIALQVGAAYEYARFRPEESYDWIESHLWSVGLGVVFKF